MAIKRYHIKIPQKQLDDLHALIKKTIWPSVIAGQNYGGPKLANMKDLTRKALNLPFENLYFANFADSKVNVTKLGIHMADA